MCAFADHRVGFDKKLRKSEGVIGYKIMENYGNRYFSIHKRIAWVDGKMTVGAYSQRKMKEHPGGSGPGIYAWREIPKSYLLLSHRKIVKVLLYGRVIRYYAMGGGMYPGGYMAEKAEIIEVVR